MHFAVSRTVLRIFLCISLCSFSHSVLILCLFSSNPVHMGETQAFRRLKSMYGASQQLQIPGLADRLQPLVKLQTVRWPSRAILLLNRCASVTRGSSFGAVSVWIAGTLACFSTGCVASVLYIDDGDSADVHLFGHGSGDPSLMSVLRTPSC
eukprot:3682040-Pleurochrysis_carterae.AAC.2